MNLLFKRLDDHFTFPLPDGRVADICINHSKRAHRLSLKIATKPFLHVRVTKPARCPAYYVHQFLQQQTDWVMKYLPMPVAINDGGYVLFRGAHYHIKLLAATKSASKVRIEQGNIIVSADNIVLTDHLRRFFKQQAKKILPPRVNHYADLLNKQVHKITLSDTQSQWGRCNIKNEISINWRLIMAPDNVSDYVCAHEAAHLVEMNHSSAFWQIVDEISPERKKAQQWLKNNGLMLHNL